jgi:hypothetical protein
VLEGEKVSRKVQKDGSETGGERDRNIDREKVQKDKKNNGNCSRGKDRKVED